MTDPRRPDDDRLFTARWNTLARILLVDPSVKHIARAAADYADFGDGTSCRPSNERLARETGYSERTVRTAWGFMRGVGMAIRVVRGTSYLRQADEYELHIPAWWENLPVLGPRGGKFTCPACKKMFNPVGNCDVTSTPKGDEVTYQLEFMTFCPTPKLTIYPAKGEPFKIPECQRRWDLDREKAKLKRWAQMANEDRWALFRAARNDAW